MSNSLNLMLRKPVSKSRMKDEDVIQTESGLAPFISEQTFVVKSLLKAVRSTIPTSHNHGVYSGAELFTDKGFACQVLKPGWPKWASGKLRLRLVLEFEPDEEILEITPSEASADPASLASASLDEILGVDCESFN